MQPSPVVSAIMPAFNAQNHIDSAIEGVLGQTFDDWELVIVDDGSSDRTAAVAEQFADPRIRVIRLVNNVGRGRARNIALRACSGHFIAICDADDISLSRRFSIQVQYLVDHPETDVVATQLMAFDAHTEPRIASRYPRDNDAIQRRFARGRMAVPNASAMIRARVFDHFGPYCEQCHRAQDKELFLRIRAHCVFHTLDEPQVLYRQSEGVATLRRLLENASYSRYARYHAAAGTDAVAYAEFMRRWDVRFKAFVYQPAVIVADRLISALRGPRQLR